MYDRCITRIVAHEMIHEARVNPLDVYIQPHMHVRGKDYEVRLVYPTGGTRTVFRGRFDFNWQLGYDLEKQLTIPEGTKVQGIAHYDNSANNKWNPDPAEEVVWRLQNWEERYRIASWVFSSILEWSPRSCLRLRGPAC